MRIVIITGEYPPMEGGVGAYTARLASALAEQCHDIHIFTSYTPTDQPEISESNYAGKLTIHRAVKNWSVAQIAEVKRLISQLAPDAVNIQYEPAAYRMRAGITILPCYFGPEAPPVVVTFHDLLPPYLFPKAGPVRTWSVTQLARHAAGIIVTNHSDESALRSRLEAHTRSLHHRTPPIRLIPIGSNITAQPLPGFDRNAWRSRYGLSPDDLVVGFFGFMNRTKGIETLIEALAQLKHDPAMNREPVHLLFIGGRTGTSDITNERYAAEIDALIAAHHLDTYVHRTGYADAAEVSAAFYAADMCALPYTEGANLRHGTLHAALAHGCPIITTAPAESLPELHDGEHALLIPPGDAGALAEAILALARDPLRRQRLSQAARTLARAFTWPQIAHHVADFIAALRPAP